MDKQSQLNLILTLARKAGRFELVVKDVVSELSTILSATETEASIKKWLPKAIKEKDDWIIAGEKLIGRQEVEGIPAPELELSEADFKEFIKNFDGLSKTFNKKESIDEIFKFLRILVGKELQVHAKYLTRHYSGYFSREDLEGRKPEDLLLNETFEVISKQFGKNWNDKQEEGMIYYDPKTKKITGIKRIPIKASLLTYYKKIMFNLIKKKMDRLAKSPVPMETIPELETNEDIISVMDKKYSIGKIKQVLPSLKEEYRNVIKWFYFEDRPVAWIAKKMDKTENAVKILLNRARKSLKK